MASLFAKLEGDTLSRVAAAQIQELHEVFVQWFQGTQPQHVLETDLATRLQADFSHVAPNGQFLQGRDKLVSHLRDKYGCYQDKVFSIDIFHVKLLWSAPNKALCVYEEWQSWAQGDDNEIVQFGRLSTCLLEKSSGPQSRWQWVHVHETWLEADAPDENMNDANTTTGHSTAAGDEEISVMTGPVVAAELASRQAQVDQANQRQAEKLQHPEHAVAATETVASMAALVDDSLPPQSNGAMMDDAVGSSFFGADTKLLVLVSNQTIKREEVAHQTHTMTVLRAKKMPYDVLDGANADNKARRTELFELSGVRGYPQFFLVDQNTHKTTYWGNYEDLMQANEAGTLQNELSVILSMSSTNLQYDDDEGSVDPFDKDETTNKDDDDDNPADNTMAVALGLGAATAASSSPARTVLNPVAENQNIPVSPVPPPEMAPPRAKASFQEMIAAPVGGVMEQQAVRSRSDVPQSEAERHFMEASQGILVFEDEDDMPTQVSTEESDSNDISTHANAGAASNNATPPTRDTTAAPASAPIPHDASAKRHVSPKLEKYAKPLTWEGTLVGVSIAGFDIGTSQGPMADEHWYLETGQGLEQAAQSKTVPKPRRKLALPEMVFPTAHVALEGHGVWLSWDVSDALDDWAKCHAEIAVHSSVGHRGVSVIKSKDAQRWAHRPPPPHVQEATKSGVPSIFHYDWTYSTPFCGNVEGGSWEPLDASGMRMELLKDQSVPILFFDEVVLYEDDLHDNGQVQYSVKLRVMPSCAYVLARLYCRVDQVVVRVRETRLLVDFFGLQPQVFRDVVWRECWWDQLATHGLPNSVRDWHFDGKETPQFHALLQQIPAVEPPADILKHAVLSYHKSNGDIKKDESQLLEL